MSDLLAELAAWLETRLAKVHTITIAEIVTFTGDPPRCSIQPLLKRTYSSDGGERQVVTLPQIEHCPILYPSGGGWSFTWPLKTGDKVLALVCERSTDRWLASQDGAAVSPDDPRKHDLSDAIVLAGIRPWAMTTPVDQADMVITREVIEGEEGPRAQIRLKPDGSVLIGEGATLGVARATDPIEITNVTAPALYAALAAIASGLTPAQPAFTGPIGGLIKTGSTKVKAT